MAEVTFPTINISSEKFDLDNPKSGASGHSDGKIVYACVADNDRWNDDEIEVVGETTSTGYKLSIATNAEVTSGLWNGGGKVDFIQTNGQWSMTGYSRTWNGLTPVETPWKFCNPDQVFEIALAGLECALGDANQNAAELIASIRAQKEALVTASDHYGTNQDCTPIVSASSENNNWDGYGTQGWE